jgi:rRNA-processing protein FCF1
VPARLYAKCIPTFTDCTIAELEKLGPKYRLALRVAKDTRWERLKCSHTGTYADDCIVDRVSFVGEICFHMTECISLREPNCLTALVYL